MCLLSQNNSFLWLLFTSPSSLTAPLQHVHITLARYFLPCSIIPFSKCSFYLHHNPLSSASWSEADWFISFSRLYQIHVSYQLQPFSHLCLPLSRSFRGALDLCKKSSPTRLIFSLCAVTVLMQCCMLMAIDPPPLHPLFAPRCALCQFCFARARGILNTTMCAWACMPVAGEVRCEKRGEDRTKWYNRTLTFLTELSCFQGLKGINNPFSMRMYSWHNLLSPWCSHQTTKHSLLYPPTLPPSASSLSRFPSQFPVQLVVSSGNNVFQDESTAWR